MTMALSIRTAFCPRTITRALKSTRKHANTISGPLFHIRSMNTLQEVSTIYKAFKRGGPAFGGWQVGRYCLTVGSGDTDLYV
jgi:hypothetical protein